MPKCAHCEDQKKPDDDVRCAMLQPCACFWTTLRRERGEKKLRIHVGNNRQITGFEESPIAPYWQVVGKWTDVLGYWPYEISEGELSPTGGAMLVHTRITSEGLFDYVLLFRGPEGLSSRAIRLSSPVLAALHAFDEGQSGLCQMFALTSTELHWWGEDIDDTGVITRQQSVEEQCMRARFDGPRATFDAPRDPATLIDRYWNKRKRHDSRFNL
jgi:hypothetical protein